MIKKKTYFEQLRAMLARNVLLKLREPKKSMWELCLPIYSFIILACMKMCIPNPNYPALDLPAYSAKIFDNYSLNLNYTIGVVPNTSKVLKFLNMVNETWYTMKNDVANDLNFIMFNSKEELSEMYWNEPTSLPLAVIFNSKDPVSDPTLEYEIRANPQFSAIPEGGELYADLINCRKNFHVIAKALERKHLLGAESCPAYEYYASGFVTLQMLFDYTKISIMGGVAPRMPNIKLQLFPKESFTANWMLLLRIVMPAYLVMALSQFIMYLLMLIVREKETKIKETLKIAGLKDSVFWLSWFIVYAAFVIVMSIIATVSMFLLRVFRNSNFFLILLLILLYGFSLIFFSFMLTPFLNHYKTAGIIGNFSVNIISLLYFIPIFVSKIDKRFLWLMSLLSPPAFTLALDKALTLDMDGRGLGFDNLWNGPGLSYGQSLMILSFDNFLYAVLAYYLDLVIPGEHGAKREPLFFLMPFVSVWRCIFQPGYNAKSTIYAPADSINNCDIEPVSQHLRDKVGIDIVDLQKHFTSYNTPSVAAINGLNLTIYEGQITAILGHNGAGKTTLFNILTGMTTPSSGTAYIFGNDIRKPEGLRAARKLFGVCPQHDILFANLTPREHLRLYAGIRGIPTSEQEDEVSRVLRETDLVDQANMFSKYLSGGQKRKLSVGIAVIGSPKVLIFDEPTAGIDPSSRRSVWSLLQKHKTGKVILLTTHFMDEADLLADRKAVISQGQLRCVGSSLFLKNKFGIGYHLTLVLEDDNKSSEVYRLVHRHVPEVELARQHGKEISLILPHSSVSNFASLFNELEAEIHENGNELKISSYGISMTTLEEVFLYLKKNEETEGRGISIGNKILKRRIQGWESRETRQRRISTNSLNIASTRTTESSWPEFHRLSTDGVASGIGLEPVVTKLDRWEIIKAMVSIRFLNILREPARYMTLAFVPLIFTYIGMHTLRSGAPQVDRRSLTLNAATYTNGSLIVQESVKTDILQYFDSEVDIKSEDIFDLLKVKPNIGALTISDCCEEIELFLVYNDTAMHSLPVILNIVNNALYQKFMENYNNTGNFSEDHRIVTKSYPFLVRTQPEVFDPNLMTIALGLGLQFIVIPIVFATDYVYDREMKAKNQLRVNGLSFWVYYGTYFFVLMISMMVLISFHLIVVYFSDLVPFRQAIAFGMLTFLLYVYTPCAILFGTLISSFFQTAGTTQSVLLNLTTFVGFVPFGLVLLMDVLKIRSIYMFVVHAIFSMFDAFYLPFAIVYFVGRIYLLCVSNEACTYVTLKDYFSPEILILLTSCCLQIPMLLLLLQLFEYWKSGTNGSPIENEISQTTGAADPDEEQDSDDIKFEKYRVTNCLSASPIEPDHPLIILKDVKKYYYGNGDKNLSRRMFRRKKQNKEVKKQKIREALTGLTFAVGPGEILGLLGHNGAGKTTTMKILTTEEPPNSGKVQLMTHDLLSENFKNIYAHIGYCPQNDVLWKNITIREHIELYATIRGIPKEKVAEITNSYLTGLQITEHADKFSCQCSGGTKRKLSFAIAMIGNPSVVLMDEPSAGMDPHSKRFMWDTILCSLQGNRSAILTTQAMEEADAVCSRVAIMVNGKLKCIGSTQHLKNLYGEGYTLEIKIIADESSFEREQKVKQFVNEIFPMATLEETFSEHLVYSIPQTSVQSLALCFTKIEEAREALAIEEYSFSQTTLEQIFLKFAHINERN